MKADSFGASCYDIIIVVVVVGDGGDDNENDNDNDDDNNKNIGEIKEREGFHDDGALIDIEENIDDNFCTPPLFDFVFPVIYCWIILYCDP